MSATGSGPARSRIGMAIAGLTVLAAAGLVVVVTLREPQGRFVLGRDVVVDRRTGLQWQRDSSARRIGWRDAGRVCRELRIDGAPARLPTRDELRSLLDERRLAPVIDPSFAGALPVWYWSSTSFPGTSRFVWGVSFEHGGLHPLFRDARWPVRCVGTRRSPEPARPNEPSPSVARDARLAPNAVVRRADASGDRITLGVATRDGRPMPATQAGQTLLLGLPLSHHRSRLARDAAFHAEPGALVRRRYSIVSPPAQRDRLEVTVRLRPDGVLSPRLLTLREGDPIWLGTRSGTSLRTLFGRRDLVFVGAGAGIAHFIAYLRGELECDGARRVLLLHGANGSDDLWFREELERLDARCPAFTYVPTLLRAQDEPRPWTGRTGAIEDLWGAGVVSSAWGVAPSPPRVHVSMCANPPLLDRMIAILRREGFREPRDGRPGDVSWCEPD